MINSVKISGSTAYCLISNETTKTDNQLIKPTRFSCVARAWNGHFLTWQMKIFRVGKFDKLFWSFHWMCPQQHWGILAYPQIVVELDINTQWDMLLAKMHFPTSWISAVYYHTSEYFLLNVYSSPPTTPHHSWAGPSGCFWLVSVWSFTSLSACSPPVCSQSSPLNEVSPELLPLYSLFPWSWLGAEWTQDAAREVSLLSDRRTPLSELYSLFESAPRAVIKQKEGMGQMVRGLL